MSEKLTKIVRQFCAVLESEGWSPEQSAIEKIVDTSFKNKEVLRKMLSRHPKWDDTSMRIILPIEPVKERINVPEKMDGFRLLCEGIDTRPLRVFEKVLTRGGALTSDDCDALKICGYYGGKVGQKIGRAINTWATTYSVSQHKDYNWRFNELINGGKNTTNRLAILSINPVDYLTASHGDFDSCHNINRKGNHRYRSGNLSYAMDGVSMVFFTVGTDETVEYPTKRIDRIYYHFDSGLLIQGRLYTATRENIHAVSRAMICKVIANCMEVPDLWIKRTEIDQDRIITKGNHYPDYAKNPSACSMLTLSDAVTPDTIEIGHMVYCIGCGANQDESSVLSCCEDDQLCCDICGGNIIDDYAIWVDGNACCDDCASYCDYCEEYKLEGSVQWLSDQNKQVCDCCLNTYFIECVACAKYVEKDDAIYAGRGNHCPECYSDRYAVCEGCNETYEQAELIDATDGRLLCEGCYQEQFSNCDGCAVTFKNEYLMETPDRQRFCKECFAELAEQAPCPAHSGNSL